MLNERSFSEILNDLSIAAPEFSSGYESHLEPFGMSQLLHEVKFAPIYKVSGPPSVQHAYPKSKIHRPIIPRPSHLFNEYQLKSFSFLAGISRSLQDNFNLHELKSAYRMAVLKTHPDQGGNSETFQEVKKSYHILQALVKN